MTTNPTAPMAGTRLPAGLTFATVLPDLDFETISEAGYCWTGTKWTGPPGAPKGKKGLEVVGAAVYAKHPTCRVLSLAYDLKDGRGKRHWRPGLPAPQDLLDHVVAGGLLEAWNVGFERWIWEEACVKRMGWPEVLPWNWRCAMAKARAHALPGKLAEAGRVLGLDVVKDADGDRLVKKFTVLQNPSQADPRTRIDLLWEQQDVDDVVGDLTVGLKGAKQRDFLARIADDVADTQRFAAYNVQDIAAEAALSEVIPDLSEAELRYWQDDQTINHRGVQIDVESVHNCVAVFHQAHQRYGEEMREVTGGIAVTEVAQLQGWLHAQGVHLDSLDEEHIEDALAEHRRGDRQLPPAALRALQIRSALGSASVKKLFAMLNRTTPAGRLHDTYVYHGARTGRPTGEGVQSTNLPKAGPSVYRCGYGFDGKPLAEGGCGRHHGSHAMHCHWCGRFTLRGPKDSREWSPEAMLDALEAIGRRSLDWLEALFGDALHTLAGVLRGLFIAAPGHEFVSSDYTAIEGVVIAELAGEKWRHDVFAGHGKIYEMSAAKILGITFDEMMEYRKKTGQHHPGRQNPGKIAELGLGFGGWINAWKQFDGPGTDDEIKANILAWRAASPAIVHLWGGQFGGAGVDDRWTPNMHGLEGMAILAVQNSGTRYEVTRLDGTSTGIAYLMKGDVLYCRVPSGGIITYHRPRLQPAEQTWRGLSLSFEGFNTNPKNGPRGWIRLPLYGGRAAENVTQKVARDKQMPAIARCHDNGYPVVMHTYDEIVSEVPIGFGSVEHFESLMTTSERWNVGWPLKAAGGWRSNRYRKG